MPKEIPQTELQWFKDYIARVRWQKAKSQDFPHSYTVREWFPDDFEQAVLIIRHYGVAERFYNKTYLYLHLDGLKYWTMGFPVDETIIINCADADSHYGFETRK
jgi:hypothetical protein